MYIAWLAKAPALQELANAARLSGVTSQDMVKLASLGAYGSQPQNIQRDLLRSFFNDTIVPKPYIIMDVPFKIDNHRHTGACELMLPHDWFAAVSSSHLVNDVFGVQDLSKFWQGQHLDDPKLHGNTLGQQGFEEFVPFLLHGDGAQFQRRDSITVVSMKSILSAADTLGSHLMLAAVPKRCRYSNKLPSDDTWHPIWETVCWSLKAMFEGKHPCVDERGFEFARNSQRGQLAGKLLNPRGLKGVIFTITGDLEYFANDLGLSHSSSRAPCWLCKANTADTPYNDFRPAAKWRATVISPEAHRCNPPTKHLLMNVPGIVAETFAIDCLHTLELGVTAHTLSNIMFDFVFKELEGTRSEALTTLWDEIQRLYRTLQIDSRNRIPTLKLESFCQKGSPWLNYPELHGIKAREARYLVPVFAQLFNDRDDTEYKQHRRACISHLNAAYIIIDANLYRVPRDQHARFVKHIDAFLLHYTWLANTAFKENCYQWSVVPKHHYTAHLPQQAKFLSPRVGWTYGGESMVGKISQLAMACLDGTPAHKVGHTLFLKYCAGMHLRFQRQLNM